MKMVGNYVTYQIKAGGSAHCRCFAPNSPYENLEHILATCSAYSDIRNRMIEEYMILCSLAKTNVFWQETISDKNTFCQLIPLQTFAAYLRIHLGRLDKLQGKAVTHFREVEWWRTLMVECVTVF